MNSQIDCYDFILILFYFWFFKLLRQVAETLGIEIAKSLPKRAIQFGSRIAKMYDNNNVADAKYR